MKSATVSMISDLENVRVGLMQFGGDDGGDGAKMLSGLTSVTDDTRAGLLSTVDELGASGWTPLGESFEDVGRYFITGHEDEKLTFKKKNDSGEVVTVEKEGQDIFQSEPEWANVSKPGTGTDSAIQYYCQKNFMVALTDGVPLEDEDVSDDLAGYDYDCEGPKGCTKDENGGNNNASMDDVIKALYDLDLRPDLTKPDGSPIKNNIISYVIGFADEQVSASDLMVNAAYFGSGGLEDVYSASNAETLVTTFKRIINKVRAIDGSSSSIAFNSASLQAGSALYAASFDSSDWSGDLSAFTLDADGTLTESWSASDKLDDMAPGDRVMITSQDGTGVAFTTALIDGNGKDHEEDLKINTSSGESVVDNLAAARVNYLRGDRGNEGTENTEFRQRGGRLGDIVNSTPVYVGVPNAIWGRQEFPEALTYATFQSSKSNRTPVVYVGANDGFLHGFNARNGEEVIAYAPEALLSTRQSTGLHALSSQLYTHRYYVDGTPSVTDAYIGNSWKTVLVGNLRGGGKGYFALDVTNPDSFSQEGQDQDPGSPESVFMWEFTDSDNSNLGFSFSRAQIGRMANGKWAAVFGNGYNSETGDAGLFIHYLDGSDVEYLSTETADADDKNGLSTPAIVDTDRDGTIDRVYAGDLKGNMWAFDVSGASADNWKVAYGNPLLSVGEPITAGPRVARNTDYVGGGSPNLLVMFGTGQYLVGTDTADSTAGGFYVVSDNGAGGLGKDSLAGRTIGTKDVAQVSDTGEETETERTYRTLNDDEQLVWGQKSGWYIQLEPGNTPDGVDGGERVITTPDLLRNTLLFNTMIPTGQVCSAGGRGWLMSVDVRTGLAPDNRGIFDANGDGVINTADKGVVGSAVSGGSPNRSGFIGGGSGSASGSSSSSSTSSSGGPCSAGALKQLTSDSSGNLGTRGIDTGGCDREGRLSWEEATPL
ncbi:pilus assembly protein [Microbulbifer sp.]|uniref:pilus assembly protein n=1 Tax=Microbulbifer sp. TaxID=1908541 RepID=UPI003F3C5B3A